jgi:hypothetical protein
VYIPDGPETKHRSAVLKQEVLNQRFILKFKGTEMPALFF